METKYDELVEKMKRVYLDAVSSLTYAEDRYEVEECYDNLLVINENTGIVWALAQLLPEGAVSEEEKEIAIQKGHERYQG